MDKAQTKTAKYIASVGILMYSTWILEIMLNPRLSLSQSYVSELTVSGQPRAIFFHIANYIGSICMSVGFFWLAHMSTHKNARLFRILCFASVMGIINAIFPMSCAPSQSQVCLMSQENFSFSLGQWIHLISAVAIFSTLLLAQFYTAFYMAKDGFLHWFHVFNFLAQSILNSVIVVICLVGSPNVGIYQRISLLLFAIWILTVIHTIPTAE